MIEHSEDPGRIARVAFTYAHIPIIAGIVVSAVAAELMIAHPRGHTGWGVAASILGGPALFLRRQPLVQGADRALAAAVAPGRASGFSPPRSSLVPWLSPLALGALALAHPGRWWRSGSAFRSAPACARRPAGTGR